MYLTKSVTVIKLKVKSCFDEKEASAIEVLHETIPLNPSSPLNS